MNPTELLPLEPELFSVGTTVIGDKEFLPSPFPQETMQDTAIVVAGNFEKKETNMSKGMQMLICAFCLPFLSSPYAGCVSPKVDG